MQHLFTEFSYLVASILFILGMRGLSHPETARRGMHLAEIGMLMAVVGTLVHHDIISYRWIITGLALGSVAGTAMGLLVPMTALPQQTALSHAFGALAAALVGVSEYHLHGASAGTFTIAALGVEVLLGSLTTTGSVIASAKLQGLLPTAPLAFKGQNYFTFALFASTLGAFLYLLVFPSAAAAFYLLTALSLVVGTTAGSNRHLEIPHERLEIAVRDIKARVVPTAILFGSEKFGLSNEDISHCHLTMAIPSRDEHRSMNLGQAVAVTLYEFIRDGDAPSIKGTPDRTAQLEDMERLSELLGEALTLSGFTKPPTTTSSALKLRRMVNRMGLSKSDAIHWQGMMRQMLWKMRNPE